MRSRINNGLVVAAFSGVLLLLIIIWVGLGGGASATKSQPKPQGLALTSSRSSYISEDQFWTFWKKIYRETEDTYMHPRMVLRPGLGDADTLVYDAWFISLGQVTLHGYYAVPKRPASFTGDFPAVLLIHGYGDKAHMEWARDFARNGYAALSISLRGHGKSRNQYQATFPGVMTDSILDPYQYTLTGFVADALRGTDYLRQRPEVDKKRIFISGGSMGGGLSIIAAGMDPRIKAIAADIPFLCDIPDSTEKASQGPYVELKDFLTKYPGKKNETLHTLAYVDARNFAPYVKCPTLIGVGMKDKTCPPEGIFKTYRVIKAKKNIMVDQRSGHVVIHGWRRAVYDWFETNGG